MPVFAYRARTAAGRAEHGVVDAESAAGAPGSSSARAASSRPTLRADAASRPAARARVVRAPSSPRSRGSSRRWSAPACRSPRRSRPSPRRRERPGRSRRAHARAAPRPRGRAARRRARDCPRVFPPLYRELVRAGEASGALGARPRHGSRATRRGRARARAGCARRSSIRVVMAVDGRSCSSSCSPGSCRR